MATVNGVLTRDGVATPANSTDVAAAVAAGTYFWLDLDAGPTGAGPEIADLLSNTCHFHQLAVSSALEFNQRARIDNYDDFAHVVAFGMGDDGTSIVEVHTFVTATYLVTVHQGACAALDAVREHFATHPAAASAPPQLVGLFLILDALADSFFPVLSGLDDQIDDLAASILKSPTEAQLGEIFDLKRRVLAMRKVVAPERDMLSALNAGAVTLPGATPAGAAYFRSLYDHLIRIGDMVDTYRDLISQVMDTHLSMVSNRLNLVMKQLAVIATVFLPLGFLTGFFGQNFAWVIGRAESTKWDFFIWGLGLEVIAIALLMWLFKRRGWLGSGPTA